MSEAGIAVAASVLMHVAWNIMARHQPCEAFALWWILLAHLVMLGPWGVYTLLHEVNWTPAFATLLLTSAAANAVYFMALRRAYELAPVALVYPLVRSSPFLIALWSMLFLHESLRGNEWLGIAISVAGLLVMARSGRHNDDGRAALRVDRHACHQHLFTDRPRRHRSHPQLRRHRRLHHLGYAASWAALTLDLRRATGAWIPYSRPRTAIIAAGGLCVGLAYALVIHAMRTLPSAVVVAYTNAGIVIATAMSIFVFREKRRWKTRAAAAIAISLGLFTLGG